VSLFLVGLEGLTLTVTLENYLPVPIDKTDHLHEIPITVRSRARMEMK